MRSFRDRFDTLEQHADGNRSRPKPREFRQPSPYRLRESGWNDQLYSFQSTSTNVRSSPGGRPDHLSTVISRLSVKFSGWSPVPAVSDALSRSSPKRSSSALHASVSPSVYRRNRSSVRRESSHSV